MAGIMRPIGKARQRQALKFNELRRERSSELISRYSRRVHKHGNVGITSAHDARHVGAVSQYAKRMAGYFGGTRADQLAARDAGHLHDRIRLPTEELMSREEATKQLAKFMLPGTPKEKVEKLINQALEHRKKLGGQVSDYAQKNALDKLSSDEITGAFLREKLMKNKRLKSGEVDQIINAIVLAGKLPEVTSWRKNLSHSALVFADKFFEANGAFVAFRRSYFMGERSDRRKQLATFMEQERAKGIPEKQAFSEGVREIVLDETKKRITAYSNLSTIPEEFHPFIRYQANWQFTLKDGLEKREPWALNLATNLFAEGLKEHGQQKSLEQAIKDFKPLSKNGPDAQFKQETLRYLNGQLWKKFVQLVKRSAM